MAKQERTPEAIMKAGLLELRKRLETESKMWRDVPNNWYAVAGELAGIASDLNGLVQLAIIQGNRDRAGLEYED